MIKHDRADTLQAVHNSVLALVMMNCRLGVWLSFHDGAADLVRETGDGCNTLHASVNSNTDTPKKGLA